ncbi:MAG: TonB-dependent receptor plug domain-containing protein, partial [Chitinophagaceae bacterium]|nr:TonB-dependent receptor plug domain-containing protein [Chitinophagaceae bacterium]
MKLTAILLTVVFLQASANGKAQHVSFSGTNVSLEKLFSVIRQQTGYSFFYRNDDLLQSKPVTIRFHNTPLESALSKIFMDQPLGYSLKDKMILVTLKKMDAKMPEPALVLATGLVNVKGIVTNERNEPVIVSVTVRGTSTGTSTNEKGEFELKGIDEKATLVFTGINIETKEIKLAGRTELSVTVQTKIAAEMEVVVSTGYQTLKKGQLTGAYATLSRERYLQAVPVNGNIVDNLEGRISGLMLNLNQSRNNWADPNNTSPFAIRGVSTFEAIKKPLIVLNGYPTEIDIETINPFDIENITVLKDAASAAIYGVRASNGVIVINTKKGSDSKPVFNFTTAQTFRPRPDYNKLNLLKGRKLIDFEKDKSIYDIEANFNSKDLIDMNNGTYTPVFSIADDLYNGKITQEEADQRFNALAAYDNTNDYKKLFLQDQWLQTYDLNMSGGGANTTYFLGINRVDNQGGEKYSGNNKTTLNYRGSFDISKKISLELQTVYSNMNTKSAAIPNFYELRSYQPFFDANGHAAAAYLSPFLVDYYGFGDTYGTISQARNAENMAMGLYDEMYYPYREMFETRSRSRTDLYRLQGNLKIKLLPGLNLEAGGVYERQVGEQSTIASENAYETRIMLNYYAAMDPVTGKPQFRMPQGGVKKTVDNKTSSYTLRAQLTYNKDLGARHSISLLGGAETRKIDNDSRLYTVFGYDSRLLSIKPMDLSIIGNYLLYPEFIDHIVPTGGYAFDQTMFENFFNETSSDDRFVSWYGNAAYTLDQKYAITGSLRIDQSNLFGNDPKFRYTPLWSAGASWNIHREDFMLNANWVDELKLRVAAGYNGNIIKRSGPFNI